MTIFPTAHNEEGNEQNLLSFSKRAESGGGDGNSAEAACPFARVRARSRPCTTKSGVASRTIGSTTREPRRRALGRGGVGLRGEYFGGFAGGEDGVDMDLNGVFDAASVASGLRGDHRDAAFAGFLENARVAPL